MPAIAYTVIATLPNDAIARNYIAWLEDGHIDAVIKGGAHSASIVRLDPDDAANRGAPGEVRVEVRYIFATRQLFDRYIAEFAPALRAEGQKLFGPSTGVRFARTVGVVI
jgi:hypothetical protein